MSGRVHVAFTPDEAASAPLGIVVDVLRATSTMAQALAAGYERVLCAAEIEEARALRAATPESLVGGERNAVRIEGFDLGASPREFLEPRARTLILSTTNGTRTILAAAARCDEVLLASLLNLGAVARVAAERGDDVAVLCAGFQSALALDDAYCAGRIDQLLPGRRSDAAIAAELVACAFATSLDALNARTYGPPGLEEDIAFCARENVLEVVPRLAGMVGTAAEIRAA
jgi:2-phosphosulfolactate phosphatase